MVNTLNTEMNPTCHLLALLEAHHILHISRIRVNGVYFFSGLRYILTTVHVNGSECAVILTESSAARCNYLNFI
jgi:hypothetical protein